MSNADASRGNTSREADSRLYTPPGVTQVAVNLYCASSIRVHYVCPIAFYSRYPHLLTRNLVIIYIFCYFSLLQRSIFFFFLMIRRPPRSPLFPSTTLFR